MFTTVFETKLYLILFYLVVAALPVSVWVKYFFLDRYKKAKTYSAEVKEFMILFGIVAISLLVPRLFHYWYETFQYYNFVTPIPWYIMLFKVVVALIPVIAWTKFVYIKRLKDIKTKKGRRRDLILLIVIFILGTLTVPLLALYYNYLDTHPNLNYYIHLKEIMVGPHMEALQNTYADDPAFGARHALYENAKAMYDTVTIVIDAWLEEIVKLSLLIFLAYALKLVKTIGDAIAFSVLAGLGFAFIENIVYFMEVYTNPNKNTAVFFNVVIFRTIVLSIGHMTFSGIFGYFYGLSKFGLPLYEEHKWEGAKFPVVTLVSKAFRIPMERAYSAMLFTEGMLLAMLTHAAFNSFLGFNIRDYAVYLVVLSAIYVYYLTQRKAGHMVLATLGRKKLSLMAPKDEDVVLELAGMWIQEGKYKEVEEICMRLEQKDPDNAVIKLLYAKAHDKRRVKRAKLALASLFFQEDIFEEDVSIFQKWKQIRAEREAAAKGVDVKIAEDLTPQKTFTKQTKKTKKPKSAKAKPSTKKKSSKKQSKKK